MSSLLGCIARTGERVVRAGGCAATTHSLYYRTTITEHKILKTAKKTANIHGKQNITEKGAGQACGPGPLNPPLPKKGRAVRLAASPTEWADTM